MKDKRQMAKMSVTWFPHLALDRFRAAAVLLFSLAFSMANAQDAGFVANTETGQFDCIMDPALALRLGAAVPGIVSEVFVARGDRVVEGQEIARLDSRVETAGLEVLKIRARDTSRIAAQQARLDFISSRRARLEELSERGVASNEAIDEIRAEEIAAANVLIEAEMQKQLAQSEVEQANILLDLREVRSPIDGFIVDRALGPGEFVDQNDYLVTVVQLDPLHVEVFLPVALFKKIGVGDKATVYPAAPVTGAHTATVTVVDRVFDASSGTFGVRLALPNPAGLMPAGHRCTVSFPGLETADLDGG